MLKVEQMFVLGGFEGDGGHMRKMEHSIHTDARYSTPLKENNVLLVGEKKSLPQL